MSEDFTFAQGCKLRPPWLAASFIFGSKII
jgi:hypothetical protein